MQMRTHVEVDPGIGMIGFEAVEQLARDHAWAMDVELCVFPQEGLTNNPGTEELLIEGLRRGARAIGAVPYFDSDPRGQIDRIFATARDFDAEIDMHLDLAETTQGMQIEYVCRKTEEYGWGGRGGVGHATQMSLLPPDRFAAIAAQFASAGVAVTILPSTDLHLMGRSHDHAVPRGVVPAEPLRKAGVTCSISTNNVLNPFTPYGDASLIRMANLYANVCHVSRPADLAGCLDMITGAAARTHAARRLWHRGWRTGRSCLLGCAQSGRGNRDACAAALGHQARPGFLHPVSPAASSAGKLRLNATVIKCGNAAWGFVEAAKFVDFCEISRRPKQTRFSGAGKRLFFGQRPELPVADDPEP